MIIINGLTIQSGKRVLFANVNLKFTSGNCCDIIGANGTGKSTMLRMISGELEPTRGTAAFRPDERLSMLSQDHFVFDEYTVINTILMGHNKLQRIMKEKDTIYAKEDFPDEDGVKAAELEEQFANLDGRNAESETTALLSGLGIKEDLHYRLMGDTSGKQKVRVLLACCLFGKPNNLLLDEPTNSLDLETVSWLEDCPAETKSMILAVSRDRHFLDAMPTRTVDIDFSKVRFFTGNYSYWYESSQLALRQQQQQNKKLEKKKKELEEFTRRSSTSVTKGKQTTSRRKVLERLDINEIEPSSRRYPGILFQPNRGPDDKMLEVDDLSAVTDGGKVFFKGLIFNVERNDKIVFISCNPRAMTILFKVISGNRKTQQGNYKWGQAIATAHLPSDNSAYFDTDMTILDWLGQFVRDTNDVYLKDFLDRMLFSGEEVNKCASVLSGGEKMYCMTSRIMLPPGANVLILDTPTSHLDLESIQAFNNAPISFKGNILFPSHDHEFIRTVANHVVELALNGIIGRIVNYDGCIFNLKVAELREKYYNAQRKHMPMARILAIDCGTKRAGLVITDSLRITPGMLDTMPARQLLNYLADYLGHEEVETIVPGKPTQMDTTPSATQQAIQALVKKLQHLYPQIHLECVDERFASVLTQQTIREANIGKQRRRQGRGLVDRVSATIILQNYLESLRILH